MNAIVVGPMVFAPDRFAAILSIAAFLFASGMLSRKVHPRFSSWGWSAVISFVIGGRLGHVIGHAESFLVEPLRVFAIWQGGFSIETGIASAALVTAFFFRRNIRDVLWTILPAAVAAFVAIFVIQLTAGTPPTPLPAGNYATLAGGTIEPSNLKGQPIVINLWATWCPPCRREMPMMADVAMTRDDALFIFANQGEGREAVEAYLVRETIAIETVLLDSLGEFARHYALPGLPATLFISSDGTLQSVHMGEISHEMLNKGIDALK